MAKIYSKQNVAPKAIKPKKEVISFLLNYSKAMNVIKIDNKYFEIISN
ncbi:hypothetical protein [Flavobacterium ovatum]